MSLFPKKCPHWRSKPYWSHTRWNPEKYANKDKHGTERVNTDVQANTHTHTNVHGKEVIRMHAHSRPKYNLLYFTFPATHISLSMAGWLQQGLSVWLRCSGGEWNLIIVLHSFPRRREGDRCYYRLACPVWLPSSRYSSPPLWVSVCITTLYNGTSVWPSGLIDSPVADGSCVWSLQQQTRFCPGDLKETFWRKGATKPPFVSLGCAFHFPADIVFPPQR